MPDAKLATALEKAIRRAVKDEVAAQVAPLKTEIARLEREYEKLLGFEATDRLRAKQRELDVAITKAKRGLR